MTKLIASLQRDLHDIGLYNGIIDGSWGPLSQSAWDAAMSAASLRREAVPTGLVVVPHAIAWSAKVSKEFESRVASIAESLGMPDQGADWLMACMAWETGETFSPAIRNSAGSGATGLIQFMPTTAKGLGTSTDFLAKLTAEAQLDYVYRYFLPYRGRLNSLADTYMAILWPAGIGKPMDWVLWSAAASPITYRQNAGLDINRNGVITKAEAAAKVQAKLDKGRKSGMRR